MNTRSILRDMFLLSVCCFLMGLCFGYVTGVESKTTPSYLSIKANDKAYIDDLASEARRNGECTKTVPLDKDAAGFPWYWLHSC